MNVNMRLPEDTSAYNLCNLMLESSHILIAGATGSGKSVLVDDIIYSVLGQHFPFKSNPEGVQLVLIDTKKVSLIKYIDLPHTIAYVTENDEIIKELDHVIEIMMDRYTAMQSKRQTLYDGCKIMVIIDELADLMTTCKEEVMPRLQRIAQLGRAAKIQLIAATQCPKRDIIPAQLTVNFTGRVALRCNNAIESRQIINENGAEKLPKYGKAIYQHSDGTIYRVIVPYTSDEDINARVSHWEKYGKIYADTQTASEPLIGAGATVSKKEKINDGLAKGLFFIKVMIPVLLAYGPLLAIALYVAYKALY